MQSTLGLLGALAGLGMGLTLTKHVAEFRNDPDRLVSIIRTVLFSCIVISFAIALLCFFSARELAEVVMRSRELGPILRTGSVLIILNAVTGTQIGALAGLGQFRQISISNCTRALSLILIGPAVLRYGVNGAIITLATGVFLSMVYNQRLLNKLCGPCHRRLPACSLNSELRLLWSFSLPAFLSTTINLPLSWMLNLLILRQPAGLTELGIYTAASQWRTLITFIPSQFGNPLIARLSQLEGEGKRPESRMVLFTSTLAISSIMFLVTGGLFCFYGAIVHVYGKALEGHGSVIVLMMASAMIQIPAWVFSLSITSRGLMWSNLLVQIIWAFSVCLLAAFYVPRGLTAFRVSEIFCVANAIYTAAMAAFVLRNSYWNVKHVATAHEVLA